MLDFILQYWLEFVFGIVSMIFTACYKKLYSMILDENKKHKAIADGMQALLRDRLMYAYNHYMDKGYYPIHARENIEKMFIQYKALGGNGVILDLVEQLSTLPTEPSFDKGETT